MACVTHWTRAYASEDRLGCCRLTLVGRGFLYRFPDQKPIWWAQQLAIPTAEVSQAILVTS